MKTIKHKLNKNIKVGDLVWFTPANTHPPKKKLGVFLGEKTFHGKTPYTCSMVHLKEDKEIRPIQSDLIARVQVGDTYA